MNGYEKPGKILLAREDFALGGEVLVREEGSEVASAHSAGEDAREARHESVHGNFLLVGRRVTIPERASVDEVPARRSPPRYGEERLGPHT